MPAVEDIERIVQEVLRRLQSAAGHTLEASPQAPPPGRLALADRVISLELIDGRLAGARELVVSSSAVVTPAVRDALRESGIALIRRSGDLAVEPAATPLLLGLGGVAWPLEQLGRLAPHFALPPLVGTAPHVVHQLCMGLQGAKGTQSQRAVLLTDQVSPATWLANQQRGIRAAAVQDLKSVNDAAEQLGANLIVIDPVDQSSFRIQAMLCAFVSHHNHTCPEPWREASRERVGQTEDSGS